MTPFIYYLQVFILSLILSLAIYSTNCFALSSKLRKEQKEQQNAGRLSIQVLRPVAKFTKKNNPEKEIRDIEQRTAPRKLSITRAGVNTFKDYVPNKLFASRYYPTSYRKPKRSRRGRRRHKRGAQINHDLAFISEYPTNRRVYKIVNKLGYCLRIHIDGTIDGTSNHSSDEKCLLAFESHGPSILRIRGFISNRYLTMNQKGVPTAEDNPKLFDSLFRLTHEENSWDTFASFKYYFEEKYDMLIGITKEAEVKKPWKAAPGQYATQFLSIPLP